MLKALPLFLVFFLVPTIAKSHDIPFLVDHVGVVWSGGITKLVLPEGEVFNLQESASWSVDRIEIHGKVITNGWRLDIRSQDVRFGQRGVISAFNNISAESGRHGRPKFGEAAALLPARCRAKNAAPKHPHTGLPGEDGQPGRSGVGFRCDPLEKKNNLCRETPKTGPEKNHPISIAALRLEGTPRVDGSGQNGGKGGNGGRGQKGGKGFPGLDAVADCSLFGKDTYCTYDRGKQAGNGGPGGNGGSGGYGGKGGYGGPPANIQVQVGISEKKEVEGFFSQAGGWNGGSGRAGTIGPYGDGGDAGKGDSDQAFVTVPLFGASALRMKVCDKVYPAGQRGPFITAPVKRITENGTRVRRQPRNQNKKRAILDTAVFSQVAENRNHLEQKWVKVHWVRSLIAAIIQSVRHFAEIDESSSKIFSKFQKGDFSLIEKIQASRLRFIKAAWSEEFFRTLRVLKDDDRLRKEERNGLNFTSFVHRNWDGFSSIDDHDDGTDIRKQLETVLPKLMTKYRRALDNASRACTAYHAFLESHEEMGSISNFLYFPACNWVRGKSPEEFFRKRPFADIVLNHTTKTKTPVIDGENDEPWKLLVEPWSQEEVKNPPIFEAGRPQLIVISRHNTLNLEGVRDAFRTEKDRIEEKGRVLRLIIPDDEDLNERALPPHLRALAFFSIHLS